MSLQREYEDQLRDLIKSSACDFGKISQRSNVFNPNIEDIENCVKYLLNHGIQNDLTNIPQSIN